MNIVLYVPVVDDVTQTIIRSIEISDTIKSIESFKNNVYLFTDKSITTVLEKIDDKKIDLLITVEVSKKVKKTFHTDGVAMIHMDDKNADDIVKHFMSIYELGISTSYRNTIYTKNLSNTSIHLIFDESGINALFGGSMLHDIKTSLISHYGWESPVPFGLIDLPVQEPKEEMYNVVDSLGKTIIATKKIALAIGECNKYNGAVVKNSENKIVHRCQINKINPVILKSDIQKEPFKTPTIPFIKNTTIQNKV